MLSLTSSNVSYLISNEVIEMKKLTAILLTSALALGGYGLVSANEGGYGHHGHKGKHCHKGKHGHHGKYGKMRGERHLKRMTKTLGLSEKQVAQIKAVKTKYRTQQTALRTKMRDIHKQLREASRADTVDKAKVQQLAQELGNIKAQKIVLHTAMREDFRNILTDAQRKKAKEMRKKRHGRHHRHQE